MKNKYIGITTAVGLMMSIGLFTACSTTEGNKVEASTPNNKSEASIPEGYVIISESESKEANTVFFELQHKKTGCVTLYTYNRWNATNTSETQWQADGKPYCPPVE